MDREGYGETPRETGRDVGGVSLATGLSHREVDNGVESRDAMRDSGIDDAVGRRRPAASEEPSTTRSDLLDDDPVAEFLKRDTGERGKDSLVVVVDRRSRLSGVRRRANSTVAASDLERTLDRRVVFAGAPAPRFDGRISLGHTHAIGLSCDAIVTDALAASRFAHRWAH